jgi:hypothetical protein
MTARPATPLSLPISLAFQESLPERDISIINRLKKLVLSPEKGLTSPEKSRTVQMNLLMRLNDDLISPKLSLLSLNMIFIFRGSQGFAPVCQAICPRTELLALRLSEFILSLFIEVLSLILRLL